MVKLYLNDTVTFPGKDSGEHFCFYFRQHWIRLLHPLCRACVGTVLLVVTGSITFGNLSIASPAGRHAAIALFALAFTVLHLNCLIAFYRYFLYVIIVTDKKIHRIKKTLVAVDDHQSVDLWVLQDIHKIQHGIIQNLLGFGSLILDAQETQVRLHFIPRIQEKYEALMHLRERARRIAFTGARGAPSLVAEL